MSMWCSRRAIKKCIQIKAASHSARLSRKRNSRAAWKERRGPRIFGASPRWSRNRYLKGNLRAQALVLWRSIEKIHGVVRDSSKAIAASRLKGVVRKLVKHEPDARLDYVEFFDPDSLAPVARVGQGTHMALAVFIGKTRLIDNSRL